MRIKPLFAALVVALSLLAYTPGPTAAGGKGPRPDPACVQLCQQQMLECFWAGGTDHECGAVYHRCLGKCGH